MIGAKTMNRSWCGRRLAICAVGIAVAVVTLAGSMSTADFSASDALMLRLMSTDNVPGAALALIKDGGIVLERDTDFEIWRRTRPSRQAEDLVIPRRMLAMIAGSRSAGTAGL